MELLSTILVITFLLLLILIFYSFNRKISDLKNKKTDDSLMEWLKSMQSSIESTNKTVNEVLNSTSSNMVKTLQENSKQLNERLDKAAVVIKEVGTEVGKMSEIGRGIRELQDFLKSPKLRGNIGEQILKDLISQMLPKNSFFIQYQFKSGEKVDAAIKTDAGILSIDSKFPMENFQRIAKHQTRDHEYDAWQKEFVRDVKKHIDAISKKYILPDEGTMDFALMYVPSETVYYEIVNMAEIIDYARDRRVYVVSPNTLYIHLQTILLSYEGKKIENSSKELFSLLRTLKIEYVKVEENLNLLGKHLNNAHAQFINTSTGFYKFGQKLESTNTIEENSTNMLK